MEYDAQGIPVVVVEDGALHVRSASGDVKTLSRGDRLAIAAATAAPVEVAQADDDSRNAGVGGGRGRAVAAVTGTQYAGLSVPAWAGVAVVAGAIGGAVYYGADDGDNGSDSPWRVTDS